MDRPSNVCGMNSPWKPGQPIRPNQPLYNPDPQGKEHAGGLLVLGWLGGIACFIVLVLWVLSRLFG